jgi:protein SCO1/2
MKPLFSMILIVLTVAFSAMAVDTSGEAGGVAVNKPQAITNEIGFDQHPGASLPLDLKFNDEAGKPMALGQYFTGGRPVVLGMVYYGCPNLCTLVLDGLFKALLELPFDAGSKYQVVLVSIDPRENSKLAAEKKQNYLKKRYKRAGGNEAIHFLTGDEKSIQTLAKTIGFRYKYDEKNNQYAHPAGVVVATPDGKLSRYFYGIEYAGRDLRLGLVEASQNKIGTPVDRFLLLCYHYDPAQGTYTRSVMSLIKIGGALTLLGVIIGIGYMLVQERKRLREQKVLTAS